MSDRKKKKRPDRARAQTPAEELGYLFEIHGKDNYSKVFDVLVKQFDVLQARAQLLLGLVTISLTITGFSGPKIAASSLFSKISISYGLAFILISAVLILMGPLQLRWPRRRFSKGPSSALKRSLDSAPPSAMSKSCNREFTRVLGRVLRRPAAFPVPAPLLRLALGQMADELLLAGARIKPAKLQRAGFSFRWGDLEAALRSMLGRAPF